MDTILYFYRNRELREALVEPVGLKSYMLIRVGLNIGEGEWFGINPDMPFDAAASGKDGNSGEREEAEKEGKSRRRFLCFPLRRPEQSHGKKKSGKRERRKQESGKELKRPGDRKQERRDAAERERLLAGRAESIRRMESGMKALAAEILELAGEESRCFAVYEDSVRKALLQENEDIFRETDVFRDIPDPGGKQTDSVLPSLWRRCMDFEEFSGYTKSFWVGLLMPQAVLHHFVILGTAPCIPELLAEYAPRMKSLKWILSEEACGPELMDFVEDYYIEYGLAIALKILSGEAEWRRLGELCALPSNILDFTGDLFLNVPRLPEGSIWLDFMSVEEKKRRIEGRCPGVAYSSLKGKWRRAQRRCREPFLPG